MATKFDGRSMVPERYALEEVLTIANNHPFYKADLEFPPTSDEILALLQHDKRKRQILELTDFPILSKTTLQSVITRLCESRSPRNTFRHASYFSTTGGGSGVGIPMPFVTDARENRAQRKTAGELMNLLGLVRPGDVVVSVHSCGMLYRSLDLMCELVEYAGGSPLAAGNNMPCERVALAVLQYRANVLFGEPGQLVQFARYVHSEYKNAEQPNEKRISFDRIVYTSEMLTPTQEKFLSQVFGKQDSNVIIGSIFGGAETGVWAMNNAGLLPPSFAGCRDFIYDTRNIVVEVLKTEATTCTTTESPYGEQTEPGRIIVTSLQKLRQPLVRYDSGDLGSIHHLPPAAREKLGAEAEHLRVIRLHGRDLKESFDWQGEYFSINQTVKALEDPALGILKWQIILKDHEVDICAHVLEVRVMLGDNNARHDVKSLRDKLKFVFAVDADGDALFEVKAAELEDFERSQTGRKVIKLVDRRNTGASARMRQPILY